MASVRLNIQSLQRGFVTVNDGAQVLHSYSERFKTGLCHCSHSKGGSTGKCHRCSYKPPCMQLVKS